MAPDKLPHPPRPSGEYNKDYVNSFFLNKISYKYFMILWAICYEFVKN